MVNDEAALKYTTLSVLRDFADDGVTYLELRTTPRALPKSNLSKAGYISAILSAIAKFESSDSRLHTKLILSVDRRNNLTEAMDVVDLTQQFAGQGVVGIDLCGDPLRGGIKALQPAFEEFRRRCPGLGMTLHFAEAEASGTDEELLMLLREWKPNRIGHVIHLSEVVKREIIKFPGGLGLELCLSCNVHAGMINGGFEAHHFGDWCKCFPEHGLEILNLLRTGFYSESKRMYSRAMCKSSLTAKAFYIAIDINADLTWCQTDDVGVFGSPLSNEYRLVARHFGLSETETRTLARKGINVIFGGEGEKQRLRQIMG